VTAGKLKSELANDLARVNQQKIEAAVDAVKRNYERTSEIISNKLDEDGYESVENDLAVLKDFKTLIDAWDWLHAHYHHFQKYHAADADAFSGGQFYLGTQCVACEFSRSQQRAVDEYVRGK
jgi:hypothetical protein